MTPQEALEILEMFLHKQCDLQRIKFAYSDIEVYCAVSMAKNALEKPLQETIEQDKSLTLVFGKDGKARVLNEDYAIYCADEETFEKVKEAVEKQIPKKATEEETNRGIDISGEYDIDFHLCCPVCGTVVGTYEAGVNEYFENYCSNCGQAIDVSYSGSEEGDTE
ncbi:MAG: hypothetical protein IJW86_09670 [Clostridia bacterium]|nr:hypothetical protein [Clostridia bacterium]